MNKKYENVYTALRSALIDRDMGDKEEDAVLIDFVSAELALKPSIPSAALLISYSMLYYPNWLRDAKPGLGKPPVGLTIEKFIGGPQNIMYPIIPNIHLSLIAVAVGVYAGFWTIKYSEILRTIIINPAMDKPIVRRTHELLKENPELTYSNARDIFIELMQEDEYAEGIPLADDYIANASFITEATAAIDKDAEEYVQQVKQMNVDLSKDFGGLD